LLPLNGAAQDIPIELDHLWQIDDPEHNVINLLDLDHFLTLLDKSAQIIYPWLRLVDPKAYRRLSATFTRNGFIPTGRITDFFGMPLHEYAQAI
jgi:hypothetical protein